MAKIVMVDWLVSLFEKGRWVKMETVIWIEIYLCTLEDRGREARTMVFLIWVVFVKFYVYYEKNFWWDKRSGLFIIFKEMGSYYALNIKQ